MLTEIADWEFKRLKNEIQLNEMSKKNFYCDCDEFEDEYSHNYISKAQYEFTDLANKFFKENQLNFTAKSHSTGCVLVARLGENI